MDVDIDPAGVDREKEEKEGKATLLKEVLVGFEDRMVDRAVEDEPLVQEEILFGASFPGEPGFPEESPDAQRFGSLLKRDDRLCRRRSEHGLDTPGGSRGRKIEDRSEERRVGKECR